jgi:hypothetical protein
MGTVHRESGFTFHIWSEDHEPPHVHAWKAGAEVVVLLDPVSVREVERMKPKAVAQAVSIVVVHRAKMLKYWREIHE